MNKCGQWPTLCCLETNMLPLTGNKLKTKTIKNQHLAAGLLSCFHHNYLLLFLKQCIVPVFVDNDDGSADDPDQYHWIAFILNYGKPGKWSKCQEIRQQYKAFKVRCIGRWISKGQIIQKESNRTNQINDSKISCFPLLIPGKKECIDCIEKTHQKESDMCPYVKRTVV